VRCSTGQGSGIEHVSGRTVDTTTLQQLAPLLQVSSPVRPRVRRFIPVSEADGRFEQHWNALVHCRVLQWGTCRLGSLPTEIRLTDQSASPNGHVPRLPRP
jgi:hypothetical protein